MKLADCGLWIDASLILNFRRPAAQSYRQLKIDPEMIDGWSHDYPYQTWLLNPQDSEEQDATQSIRDALFTFHMQQPSVKVSHRSGFDLAKLVQEAGGQVAISSHESLEALKAIATYCDLNNAELFPYKSKPLAHESFARWNRSGQKFTYVLERGIHLGAERKIVEQLADKGIMLNVKSYSDLRTTISGALRIISDKGFKNV